MEKFRTFAGLLEHVAETHDNACALNVRIDNKWRHTSTAEFISDVHNLAAGLHEMGVRQGHSVGILGSPSPAWVTADLAIMSMGAVSVPFFPVPLEAALEYKVLNTSIKHLVLLQQEAWPEIHAHSELFESVITCGFHVDHPEARDLPDVLELGANALKREPGLLQRLSESISEGDLATIIYTSGSTGVPKGVELTHGNLMSQVHGTHEIIPMYAHTDKAVSCLPLAHSFERVIIYSYLSAGVPVFINSDIHQLGDDLRDVHPTYTTVVPRILEKVYAKFVQRIDGSRWPRRALGHWAIRTASHGRTTSITMRIADRLVFAKLRASLGGQLRCIMSGGAPLKPALQTFLLNAGLPVFQGYGLTESSPILSCNYPDNQKVGTVGKAFPGVELATGKNGEIRARGPNIMRGYHLRPDETAKALDAEGWLHTGDIGEIGPDGYVIITGRIKELFKTSRGEYVAPAPIEHALVDLPLIDTAMVLGEGHDNVTCLIFPDLEYIAMKTEGRQSCEEFIDRNDTQAELADLVESVNANLEPWERIAAYRVVPTAIGVDSGELTPTMKLRRYAVCEKYADLIDDMYVRELGEDEMGTE